MSRYDSDGALFVTSSGGTTDPNTADIKTATETTAANTASVLSLLESSPLAAPTVSSVTNSTVTTGGASQQLRAAAATCKYLEITNNSAGDLWLNFGSAGAVDGGIKIPGGGTWYSPVGAAPVGTVNIFGATTGQKFSWWQATL